MNILKSSASFADLMAEHQPRFSVGIRSLVGEIPASEDDPAAADALLVDEVNPGFPTGFLMLS